MAVTYGADQPGGALPMMMKTMLTCAAALIVASSAIGQPGNLPFGNPLGDTHIRLPEASAPDPFAARDAELARRQALLAQQTRRAALLESARPMPGAAGGTGGYVDYDRVGAQQQAGQDGSSVAQRIGPVPTPFGSGITGAMGGGIRPAWDRR